METIRYRRDLYKLFPKISDIITCEVGVAEGYNSLEILNWGVKKHYMVDIWKTTQVWGDGASPQSWHDKNYEAARERVKGLPAKFLIGLSVQMVNLIEEPLDLVYLDAGHSYEDVRDDLAAWVPKVKEGGVIAGHDFLAPQYGVRRAVEEFCKGRFKIKVLPENKAEDAGFYFIK